MAISTRSEMVTATATATAILAPFIIVMRIATPTTIVMQNSKKLNCFCIAISCSASLPIRPLRNSTWSSWRQHFFTSKKKIIILECEQTCKPLFLKLMLIHDWPMYLQKNIDHQWRRWWFVVLFSQSLYLSCSVQWHFWSHIREKYQEYVSGKDTTRQKKPDIEMKTLSSESFSLLWALAECRWSGYFIDKTFAGQHMNSLPQVTWLKGGLSTFFYSIWAQMWPSKCCQQ